MSAAVMLSIRPEWCETIKATTTIVPADVTDNYVGSKSKGRR